MEIIRKDLHDTSILSIVCTIDEADFICGLDNQTTEAEKCNLQNVSQQSELLVAFCDYMAKEGGNGFIDKHSLVEGFLKATNCG